MMRRAHYRSAGGSALLTVIVLLTVVSAFAAAMVSLASRSSFDTGRSMARAGARPAAQARLSDARFAALEAADAEGCDAVATGTIDYYGYATTASCEDTTVTEKKETYRVFQLSARAWRGDRAAATLVRRVVEAQVSNDPS